MENILRFVHRPDLDMPSLIRPRVYSKLKLEPEIHATRIKRAIMKVEDASKNDSGVHLEFCFTGYYQRGEHFICAVWPTKPEKVDFHFKSNLDYERSFGGWVSPSYSPKKGLSQEDPSGIMVHYSRQLDSACQHYMFFRQNPHQPHRPYLLSRYDEMFNRDSQDDKKVLANHRERVLKSLNHKSDLIKSLSNKAQRSDLTVDELVALNDLSRYLMTPPKDLLKTINLS